MNERISAPERESRLPVGSSAKMMCGRLASARAPATRCCCPPESSEGRCLSRLLRPTVSTTLSNHSRSGFLPASFIGSVMFSAAVSVGMRLNAWKMKPMRSRRSCVSFLSLSVLRSTSPTHTEPLVSESSPASVCMSVDLPEPDGPMIAVKRPVAKSTLMSSRARTWASPLPYTLEALTARAATALSRYPVSFLLLRVSVRAMRVSFVGRPSVGPVNQRCASAAGLSSAVRRLCARSQGVLRGGSFRTRVHLGMYARIGRETDVCRLTCRYVDQVEPVETPITCFVGWFGDINPWVLDAFIGTAFTVFGLIGLFQPADAKFGFRDPNALAVLLALGCSLPFYVRRRFPFAVLLTSTTCLVVMACFEFQSNVQSQMLVVASYTVGAYCVGSKRAF